MRSYKAYIYYTDTFARAHERCSEIIFQSPSDKHAVDDVKRWFDNRHKNLPEFFARLLCVKLYHFAVPIMRDDGYLDMATGLYFYEWKYDWGYLYGQNYAG